MLSDFHLHTLVSDGDLTPEALLEEAARRAITHLSITDHDALGAYSWNAGAVFGCARRLGLELTVGIEMDADLDGVEVHVLGFGVARDDAPLRAHLESVRAARFERARREVSLVNGLLGEDTIRDSDIFVPGRETLMKPHFIHPILAKGHFKTYEEANRWYRKNVKAGVNVPKPPIGEVIALIHGAGGWTSLAHPAYYQGGGLKLAPRLAALRQMGLDAIELDYPYHVCSPDAFTLDEERRFATELRALCEPLGFRFTRGSDSHTREDFERSYGSAWAAASTYFSFPT
jgi:predicted metal-dependent phosphoesterase TrpH